jgi:23S rRNA maturation-related 3'-5' exoribonuclease YhaM
MKNDTEIKNTKVPQLPGTTRLYYNIKQVKQYKLQPTVQDVCPDSIDNML